MPTYKKVLLSAHTLLILGMIIKDPSEAHRPPNFEPVASLPAVTITLV